MTACSGKNKNQHILKLGSRLFTVGCFNLPKFPDTIFLPKNLFPDDKESYVLFHVNYVFDSTGKFIRFDSAVFVMKNKATFDLEREYRYSDNFALNITQFEAAEFWDWAIKVLPSLTIIERMPIQCTGEIPNTNIQKIDYYIE